MLALYDLVAPLERFDEALLMSADALGLEHVQYARIDPACDRGRAARVRLDEERACTTFSAKVRQCSSQLKGCSPKDQAECEATIRRVAPMDLFLYEHAQTQFQRRVDSLGPAFARRVAAFKSRRVGVFTGGPPAYPRCRFNRVSGAPMPSFENASCRALQQPQEIGEAAWRDRHMFGQGEIMPAFYGMGNAP